MAVKTALLPRADLGPAPLRLSRRGERGLGETLLLIGAIAVAGPVVVAVAGTVLLLALALAGPFFLGAILVAALVLIAVAATGASG